MAVLKSVHGKYSDQLFFRLFRNVKEYTKEMMLENMEKMATEVLRTAYAERDFISVTGNLINSFAVGIYYRGELVRVVGAADMGIEKQVRKSSHKGVLRSREWLNTQELLSRKHISVTGELFKFYIKDIIRLYCYKFLYSREYLNENAYKKRYQRDIHPRKVNVPILQLEVAWINNNCRSSDSSTDIIILPRMIRRMVVFNYTKINKQLEKVLGGIARKQTSERNKGGLYTRIKKESDFLSMDRFMVEIEKIIRPERFPTSIYPVFSHSFIERELPLLNLARSQYRRAISKRVANSIFYTLQKTNVALWLYLEMFALVAFIKLYTGKGFEFIKNMCVFIDYEKGIMKSTHEELLGEIKRNIQVNLKVNPDNFPELIDIYNSCFSENILSYDIQDGDFKWRS